ncbi:pyridoxamine 5'-phosphate oxidase family protein [Nocardioides aequoreus]|uniref:pyridoxamine 5'-phosphate oxidase family protein n=1 Tax=Nocardioides aequoreus TaxID=397278 RepID=UPI0004C2E27B|nr:pyridoxamine 5'-phosphate oxidase family protein [Nocardioides aequoreus]
MEPTVPARMPEKMSRDRAELDALLASTVLAHVALVDDDGAPVVIPTAAVAWGDRLLVHGSTGSRWMRRVAQGAPVAVSVAAIDGVVVARSAFESSLVYRSAVLRGRFTRLQGEDKESALDAVTERLLPGRTQEVRRSTRRELAATMLLAMPIESWTLRVSEGWPDDPDDDVAGPAWAGVVRLGTPPTSVHAAPDLRDDIGVPPSVGRITGVR